MRKLFKAIDGFLSSPRTWLFWIVALLPNLAQEAWHHNVAWTWIDGVVIAGNAFFLYDMQKKKRRIRVTVKREGETLRPDRMDLP